MSALNPVLSVARQMVDIQYRRRDASAAAKRERAVEMLRRVGIPDPEQRIDRYPHEFSGGMRQRICIPMAPIAGPDLLIADEPTTALDVTIQAQILDLLRQLQSELGMAILLITHDLGVVAETCAEVVVMYAGRIVERAPTDTLFALPRHHYTAGLLRSVPSYGTPAAGTERGRLQEIRGMVPPIWALPAGCKFADRCPAVQDRCRAEEPPLAPLGGALVRCWFPREAAPTAAVPPEMP
jgi:peptide/nickel transport system ATP-binding protein